MYAHVQGSSPYELLLHAKLTGLIILITALDLSTYFISSIAFVSLKLVSVLGYLLVRARQEDAVLLSIGNWNLKEHTRDWNLSIDRILPYSVLKNHDFVLIVDQYYTVIVLGQSMTHWYFSTS